MWSTDSVRVFTVDGGWVWTFAAVGPLKRRVRGLAGVQVCVVDSRAAPSRERCAGGDVSTLTAAAAPIDGQVIEGRAEPRPAEARP